ncbi:hypothetical protein OHA04_45470 (plasmid) [Streptomyces sp. NBC_01590]|uniref:hypothetical protein n=1 Tax=Streptomyces sp. NBC_01590 TaxID=2975887 RepID=UPI002F90BDA8
MTDTQPTDDSPERTREQRLAELAEKLCRSYTYGVGLEELEQTDPDEASAHRDAAEHLLPWIQEAPREDRRAAFRRGYAKGKENQAKSTAEYVQCLEAEVADLRIDRDPEGLRWRIRDLERAWDEMWVGHTGRRDIRDVTRQAHERAVAAERKLAEAWELLGQSGLETANPALFGKLAARLEPRASDRP